MHAHHLFGPLLVHICATVVALHHFGSELPARSGGAVVAGTGWLYGIQVEVNQYQVTQCRRGSSMNKLDRG